MNDSRKTLKGEYLYVQIDLTKNNSFPTNGSLRLHSPEYSILTNYELTDINISLLVLLVYLCKSTSMYQCDKDELYQYFHSLQKRRNTS